MSAIAAAARSLMAVLGPVAEMRWPADRPVSNLAQAAEAHEAIAREFAKLREALIAEVDANGGDAHMLEPFYLNDILSGWDDLADALAAENHDLAGATRAEARWEMEHK